MPFTLLNRFYLVIFWIAKKCNGNVAIVSFQVSSKAINNMLLCCSAWFGFTFLQKLFLTMWCPLNCVSARLFSDIPLSCCFYLFTFQFFIKCILHSFDDYELYSFAWILQNQPLAFITMQPPSEPERYELCSRVSVVAATWSAFAHTSQWEQRLGTFPLGLTFSKAKTIKHDETNCWFKCLINKVAAAVLFPESTSLSPMQTYF